jgi:hypothetical protein
LFDNPAVMPTAAPKKQRSLLPLLVVVFLGSYGLMTMLIVEQGAAIQQQHNLIQVLQQDSRELWAIKGKAVADKNARDLARKHAQSPATAPSTQGKAPSAQVPQQPSQSHAAKPKVQLPPVPAADLGDQRRVLITL